jgi:hypothetical protein
MKALPYFCFGASFPLGLRWYKSDHSYLVPSLRMCRAISPRSARLCSVHRDKLTSQASILRRRKVHLTQYVFLVSLSISKQRANENIHAPDLVDYFSYVTNHS